MSDEGRPLTLGVIVCCRDEERVIERRLRNLALSRWPQSERPHVVAVVDDGSRDRTAKIALEIGKSVFPANVRFEVVANGIRPGKSGAIASGLAQLDSRVDLIVLTDADVIHDPSALVELTQAFRADSRIGMACGSQTFVKALPWDGTLDESLTRNCGSLYDRWTAWVRRLESRSGRVFSVHGQLLAWRAELNLSPKSRLAADDLDLMRQVRSKGMRVEHEARARFFELRPWTSELRRAQAVRRARAYLQFARTLELAEAGDRSTRLQWWAYKHLPPAFPWIAALGFLAVVVAGAVLLWQLQAEFIPYKRPPLAAPLVWLLLARWLGRGLWNWLSVIEEARQQERTARMDDRWSTAR
ncbi:MAG TPA: glycosyltransferase [Planctomycetota bacterium]|nr:glycosyltransferase [Planctomycetota bacterium]